MWGARGAGLLHGSVALAALLLATQVAPLMAQVRGAVADPSGTPIPGALVELYGSYERLAGHGTDSLGQFRIAVPVAANGAILVRAIGFAPVRLTVAPADSVVTVTMQPLPVEMTELRVSGAPAWCPPQDDGRARDLWLRAAAHYDIALTAGLIRSWTLVFAADVPPDSLGLMDTTRLHRVFMGDEGTLPRTGWRAYYGQEVPFLESLQSWQFGDPSFARLNRLAVPPGIPGDTVIAFCSGSEELPGIRGTLTLSADTTFATASWEFVTPAQRTQAGGRVLFARTDPSVAGQPLLAMAGFYWHRGEREFFQQWMEFREWTRCESFRSCRVPVRLADRSIAVLTFATTGGDSGAAYLAEGLADGISASLSGVGRLKVVSRATVRRAAGAARLTPARLGEAVGAANLVTGSIQRAGNRLRVTVELLHAASGDRLWTTVYDTTATDLLGVQSQVASGVASRIVGQLLPGERMLVARRPTANPAAYDHYLRGNRLLWSDNATAARGAIAEYQAALRLDSTFTAARGRLAVAYGEAANTARAQSGLAPDSVVTHGLETANRALLDDSANADAWLGGGWLLVLRGGARDLELAPEALRHAVTLDPANDVAHELYGSALLRMGRFDEAEQEYLRVLANNPRDLEAMSSLGWVAYSRRSYGVALQWFERLSAVDSTLPAPRIVAALARSATGDAAGAAQDARAALAFSAPQDRLPALGVLAGMEARAGDRAAAGTHFREALRGLGGSESVLPAVLGVRNSSQVALAAVALGERDLALNLLERARPRGAGLWSYLMWEGFDPIRAEPRFQRIVDEARPPGAKDPV